MNGSVASPLLVRLRQAIAREPAVWFVALIVALIYLPLAGRYDTFRNELYFIVCGRHPAFGYADLPPLVALIAAGTQVFGDHTWLLRLPGIVAAIALVPLTAAFSRSLGGDKAAAFVSAVAVAIAPLLIAMAAVLTTSTFEPIAWTLCAFLLARAVLQADRRAALWVGIVAGVGLEAKYGIGIWMIGLGIGVVLTSARRIIFCRELWYGAIIGALIGAPSLVWQGLHGWPFFQSIRFATAHRNLTGSAVGFEIKQVLAMNFLLAPLWIAGVLAPFFSARLREARFLSLAFVAATAIIVGSHGKDYYLAPAYPTMFAVGAVACAGLSRWLRSLWLAGAVALTAPILPVVLPILSPPALDRYLARTHLRPSPNEREAVGAPLTQMFSDELGWRTLEKQVAAVYRALPPDERKRAAIMTANYGEAAAIDVYGAADGLPPALCGQLQYYLWGTHGYDGSVIVHVNGDPERWSQVCERSEIAGSFGAPYTMPYENGPIILCHGLRQPLAQMWPLFRRLR